MFPGTLVHNIEQMNVRTKNILVSIVQGLVSLPFLMGGTMKLITSYDELGAEPNMGWVGDFSPTAILAIGATELLCSAGLLSSLFVKPLGKWSALFAAGICAVMIGAAFTHLQRGEPITVNVVFFLVAAVVAFARKDRLKGE